MSLVAFSSGAGQEIDALNAELMIMRENVCQKTVPAVSGGGGSGAGVKALRGLRQIDLRPILDPISLGLGFNRYNNDPDSDLWQHNGGVAFLGRDLKKRAKAAGRNDARTGRSTGRTGPTTGRTETQGARIGGGQGTFAGGDSGGGGSYTVGNIREKLQATFEARKASREARKAAREAQRAARKARDRISDLIKERRERARRDRKARRGLFSRR
jgi:hypothetical protein